LRPFVFPKLQELIMSFSWWPILVVLAIATAWDIAQRRIPDWLVLPFLFAGLVLAGTHRGLPGVETSLAGIAVAAVLIGPFCWLRGMGLGDLKLCAGIGAWIGPGHTLFALLITAISGGIIAMAYALYHRSLASSLESAGDLIAGVLHGKSPRKGPVSLDNPAALSIPYAPAIAIGTIFVLLSS